MTLRKNGWRVFKNMAGRWVAEAPNGTILLKRARPPIKGFSTRAEAMEIAQIFDKSEILSRVLPRRAEYINGENGGLWNSDSGQDREDFN
jgi:hypothetical protein